MIVDGRVYRDGVEVHLSPVQQAIVEVLSRSPGSVFSKATIYRRCWSVRSRANYPDHLVESEVSRLREKLGDVIETHSKKGYSWKKQPDPCPNC